MVKEFGNSTDDSSEGGLGRYKNAGPSTASGRDAGGNSTNSGDDEEDPEEGQMGLRPRVGCSP